MNRISQRCAGRKFVLIAISLLIPTGIATAAPCCDANPFERSAFGNDWGILSNDIFFGGAYNLFGFSPASRTLLLTETTGSKTTSESNATVNAARANDNLFSFATSLTSQFGVGRGRGGVAPNAVTAVIEWANVGNVFATGANWVGGTAPANSTVTDIGAFGSAGSAAVNPNLTAGRSINGLSFLSGAFSYTVGSSTGSALLIGTGGITNSSTNTQTFGSGIVLRTSTTQTWTNNGGSLVFNSVVDIVGNATGVSRTLTIDGSGNTTFNGVVQNSSSGSTGSLTKTGTGTLILSNANTYNGSTSVTGGTLLVTNTTGSATGTSSVVVTNAGTTLSGGTTNGAGGISGPVAINPSATLSPGTSGTGAGTTAILNTGAVTLVGNSNFAVDLNGTTAGTGYDQVISSGAIVLTGANILVSASNGLNLLDKFFVLNNSSLTTNTGTFAQGPTVTANNGYIFAINYFDTGDGTPGNDISLTLTAVPEPSTWVGGALALAAVGFTQRRRLRGLIVRRA